MKIFKDQLIKLSGCNQPGKVRVMTTITQYDLRLKLLEAIKEELNYHDLDINTVAIDEEDSWDINIVVAQDVAKELVGNVA